MRMEAILQAFLSKNGLVGQRLQCRCRVDLTAAEEKSPRIVVCDIGKIFPRHFDRSGTMHRYGFYTMAYLRCLNSVSGVELSPPEQWEMTTKWFMVWVSDLTGASLRDVAGGLFDANAVIADWHADRGLCARVRRLVCTGDGLKCGGYHCLL